MDLIAKKYRVLKTLGKGAMGEVYLVLPPRGDPVALKLLRTVENTDPKSAVSQLENEFRVLKRLSHPNIGRIYDYGYDEELKKVYFTSPWLKGSDLFHATKDLPFEECEDLFVQLLRAINYLHQKGIIHCDLKPGNVFVENGQVLLIDFGLAGYWGESIVGTPTYLAPEVFRGAHHTVASDLYAVGVVFYNCLTRTQPYSGKSLQEVYDRHRTFTPPPVTKVNPKVPQYFSEVTANLLAKKPEERYSSATAVIEEIAAFSSKKYSVETPETLLSYLPATSELIGRKEVQWTIEGVLDKFLKNDALPYSILFLYGEHGVGKSQFVSQIKTRLQLEKINVEDIILPLSEADQAVLGLAKVLVFQDLENYLGDVGPDNMLASQEPPETFKHFMSFLEQKVLSPETTKLLLVLTGTHKDHWKPFENLFPREELVFEDVLILPFNQEETRLFLETIIGQKQIPERFVLEIYHNTGGNPALCKQIIETLIQQGLLFDESGRWSSDLLGHLSGALKRIETPRSLEEKLRQEYSILEEDEKDVALWLALSEQGLSSEALHKITEEPHLSKLLESMIIKKIIRQEKEGSYCLYKPAFGPFLTKQLGSEEQKKRHSRLAAPDIGLDDIDVWEHQSLGADPLVVQSSLEKLGEASLKRGDKEKALDCYQRLLKIFASAPLVQRVDWVIDGADILIWLDRFSEAEKMLQRVEQEIDEESGTVPIKKQLVIWEKKGLCLLHQQKLHEARFYFTDGVRMAAEHADTRAEEIRFLNDLAQISVLTGHSEEAINQFLQARQKIRELAADELLRITNNDLGHVYYQLRDYEKAIAVLSEDIVVFEKLPYKEPLARALYSMAESYRALKNFDKATTEYERCIEICHSEKLLPILLRAYNGLGNVLMTQEKFDQALASYQKAIEISVHLKDITTKAALLANQGIIYCHQQNLPQGSRRFLLAKQILESKEKKMAYENKLLAKCYQELTNIAKEEKDPMKALSFQIEHMRMAEKHETSGERKFTIKYELADLYLENRLGDPFMAEVKTLETMAKSADEKEKVDALKKRWQAITSFDQEKTMKLS